MKGYIDEKGNDRSPCGTCKHRNKMTVQEPCYSCIDNIDLALHKPNHETEFAHYEADHTTANSTLVYEVVRVNKKTYELKCVEGFMQGSGCKIQKDFKTEYKDVYGTVTKWELVA